MSDKDDRLHALFQDAAGTPPESGFSYGDVTQASRRITRRRRTAFSAVAAVVVAMAGTGVVVASVRNQDTLTSAASAPAAAPENGTLMGRGDAASGAAAPLGPSSAECVDKHDPQLRAIVEQVLPEIIGAPSAAVTTDCQPGGGRGMAVEVSDQGVTGILSVFYSPPDQAPPTSGGALIAPTASGGTVVVFSESVGPGGGTPPFAAKLQAVVSYLAPRL